MGRIDYLHDPDAPPANSVVPSVVAFVQDGQGRVLMIQRSDNGRWALPGGGHDAGESISDTVVREVWEETGIDAEVIDVSGIYTDPGHVMAYDDGEIRQQFSICFRARPTGGEVRTSSETTQVRWVAPADLVELDVHPTMRLRIEHAMDRTRTAPYIG
ncbi:mutT-like protein [Streptomyces laurentii]|uniref:MutT-like protein n=1 Tax=Streptomyces laurentii TaxID=39478 RepID=Q8GR23_STRLU|nr:NUDIX domain-containing protein [Streptomyces laurentii]BAC21274.1 mutT-like protein [Streptomyces laurentii]BAU83845.1 mutT-like protein [Streptomyces laurentii]